jgi:hypothetical protein
VAKIHYSTGLHLVVEVTPHPGHAQRHASQHHDTLPTTSAKSAQVAYP